MKDQAHENLDFLYKLLFILALAIFTIIWAKDIFIPLALGGFIAFALLPANQFLERKRVPRILSIIITLLLFIGFIGFFAWLVTSQMRSLISDLPNLETRFDNFLDKLHNNVERTFGMDLKEQNSMMNDGLKNMGSYASGLLLSTTNVIATIVQIPIYLFLFLLYRDNFKEFLLSYFPVKSSDENSWLKQIKVVINGYVSGLSLVILIIAVLNTTGLLILGIDYAIFFGVFSAFLTILPFIGNFIGAALPVLMALITKDSGWYAVGVIGVYVFVQFLEGNIITPKIMGSKVSINAFAAIFALLIGNLILGIAGMIIAIPSMGILKVILTHSDRLKPINLLISETNDDNKPKRKDKALIKK